MEIKSLLEDERIRQVSFGTGIPAEPKTHNPIIAILAHFGVPLSEIIGFAYKSDQIQGLETGEHNDYTMVFFGINPDKNLPTRILFEKENEITLFCWQIQIYWGDLDALFVPFIDATWSQAQTDYIVSIEMVRLDTLDMEAVKRLTAGLSLLNRFKGMGESLIEVWIAQTIEIMAQRQKDTPKVKPFNRTAFNTTFAEVRKIFTTRQNIYNYVPKSRNDELKRRYFDRCRELRDAR